MDYPFYLLKPNGKRIYVLTRQELEETYEAGDKIFALSDETGNHIEVDSIEMAVGTRLKWLYFILF